MQTVSAPELFLERMQGLLGDEYPAFLESYTHPTVTGLRVNLLKLSPEDFLARSPFPLDPVPWCREGFLIQEDRDRSEKSSGDESVSPGKHPYHAAGLYYLQEPSAMAVVEVLDPQPGDLVMDISAAPGGKATHIAARLGGHGALIANEVHSKRAWELAENLERWGTRNAAILNETPQRLADHFGAIFDRVLLDAPCSGEGMFRKSEAARREWTPGLPVSCAVRQTTILTEAARLVRPGGRLVYSTCTFAPEENEGVILRFLETHTDFTPVSPPALPGFAPGRPDWITMPGVVGEPQEPGGVALRIAPSTPQAEQSLACGMVRLWPHQGIGEGHFIALLERSGGPPGEGTGFNSISGHPTPVITSGRGAKSSQGDRAKTRTRSRQPGITVKLARQLWLDFARGNLNHDWDENELLQAGAYLYRLPPGMPPLNGLRVVHPGWWLGVLKKDRFEPAHALALGLESREVQRVADLSAEAPELAAYLRGEGFASAGENGWTLVTVEGFPIGWGKQVAGLLKNYYPKGLRWV